jgi:transcriptional regulator with XRE-family HTH domain
MSDTHDESRDEDQKILSQRLKETREYLGLSQEYVADQLGILRAAISAIETCRRKVSSTELKQFGRLYRRSTEYLLGEDNQALDDASVSDDTALALYHTTKDLSANDKQQVLKFAEFLRQAGAVPNKSE